MTTIAWKIVFGFWNVHIRNYDLIIGIRIPFGWYLTRRDFREYEQEKKAAWDNLCDASA
jgi:prolipoprotein diacylglyceryltransferase